MTLDDAQTHITELIGERLHWIAANKERLLEAWIAETGLPPSESVLIQQDAGTVTRFWVEKKKERDATLLDFQALVRAVVWLDPTFDFTRMSWTEHRGRAFRDEVTGP